MPYRFGDLVDINQIQRLFDSLYAATSIAAGIIDIDGTILTHTKWEGICNIYHRNHPISLERCISSRKVDIENIDKGDKYILYMCENGIYHAMAPIFVGDKWIASIYNTQFFLEEPDMDFFIGQAKSLGFDVDSYIEALLDIPIVTKEELDNIMEYLSDLAHLFSQISISKKELLEEKRLATENYEKLVHSHEELTATYEELNAMEEELRSQYNELEKRQKQILESEQRYRLAIEGANDIIWEWNLDTSYLTVSERWNDIIGIPLPEGIDFFKFIEKFVHPDDIDKAMWDIKLHLNNETQYYSSEYRVKCYNGVYKWVYSRGKLLYGEDKKPFKIAGSITDITAIKDAYSKIRKMAYYDSLTDLPNRTLFLDKLEEDLLRIENENTVTGAVILLDLDNFKEINGSLGHSIGDMLLKEVATSLKEYINRNEMLARFGGDEFSILQTDVSDISQVTRRAEDIIEIFKNPWYIEDHELYVTTSIGIAIYPIHGCNTQEILKNVDIAMYRAKEMGKNTYRIFNRHMEEILLRNIDIEKQLRGAIDRGELVLHYQPQIDLKQGSIECIEALLRWEHPTKGLLYPNEFIEISEKTGLIIPIGEWVLKEACRQVKLWHDMGYGNICVSVNVSPIQLKHSCFADIIERILIDTGIDPQYLTLEITETAVMESLDQSKEIMERIEKMGVQFALDDFGTGYSSLNYLRRLPVKTIKIDKSFIENIDKEHRLVEGIIFIAERLNKRIVAEGVETMEQLTNLLDQGCHRIQGFIFSKPLPAYEMEQLLKDVDMGYCGEIL